ncbi:MAG TPA: aminopeptidase N [Acetobacteraceae bacterium]|jgi:aminopeptidase N|nr:aminopeptidase N [Acetobacteraceae bacterium]
MPADAIATDTAPKEIRLADYTPPAFLIDTVDLTFHLNEDATTVVSRLSVRRSSADTSLHLDGEALTLTSVTRDGVLIEPRVVAGGLVIDDMPDACVLEIQTLISPKANSELSGLYVSGGNYFTQCEAQGFRRITYFPDRPDVMSRYTTTIVAEKMACPVMLSNGNPGPVTDAGNGLHQVTWIDPHPKPCYLFALVAGDLVSVHDGFVTRSGRNVELGIYVRRGDEDRCDHAMRSLKASMSWDEDVFGLEYDLDVFNIAAVSDFNMGAMENKGLNVFNTKYVLARPETATDTDYQGIESVIAHEYFHNWTGNRVTCRDWFQLSLKEGLTVYRDQEFSADQGSRAVKRIGDVRALRAAQFREDGGPLAHPVQPASYLAIDNFYTSTIYNKGAEVIRMMATIIGRAAFRRGMDLYFQRHDNHAVTINDFVQAMQDASGVDLTDFKLWYHQAGTPEVSVEDAYDPATKRYSLTLRQTTKPTPGQPVKQPQVIPVAMGLLDGNGQELATRLEGEPAAISGTRVLLATGAENRFEFVDVASPPVPSLLRDFSAPVKLSGLTPDRLRFLAAHDTDPFVRWESGQQFATAALLEMVAKIQAGEEPAVDHALIEAAAAALDQEPAFAAEALALPGEATLADRMDVVDADAIHVARDMVRAAIGRALADRLRATYDTLTDHAGYSIDGPAIGRRSLRNACLSYLVASGDKAAVSLAKAQFDAAQSMTDVLAALGILSGVDCQERTDALAAFYAAWKTDPLVLDKWFAIQALSPLPDTIQAVEALKRHPDFDLRNPNRIRALISSFAGNQVRFHDASGAGYRLYADTIIQLDPTNGQVAARMVSPLGQWRRFDAARQGLMKAQLQRILDLPGLSRNTFEMASKSLA